MVWEIKALLVGNVGKKEILKELLRATFMGKAL